MSLQARLTALATAVGTDIKTLNDQLADLGPVALDTWHEVTSFLNGFANVSGDTPAAYMKDPFGKVSFRGLVVNTANASDRVIFTLPVGYRPPVGSVLYQRWIIWGFTGSTVVGGQAYIHTNGNVVLGATEAHGTTTVRWDLSSISFDTETVDEMPVGPKGPKGDPGDVSIFTTLDWNTALTPGFYRSTNDIMADTVNGPGDTLNPPPQAGIVSAHENGALVQRVWDLSTQQAWVRYRNVESTWSAWVADLVKPPLRTESVIGGATPQDGDERYFQTAAMKALGVLWKFRYNATSASAYKWEFAGGGYLSEQAANGVSYTTAAAAYSYGPALAVPKVTFPLSGDFRVRWQCGGQIGTSQPGDLRVALFVNAVAKGTAFGSTSSGLPNFAMPGEVPVTGITEGQIADLRLAASIASANVSVWDRGIAVQPIRVSGL